MSDASPARVGMLTRAELASAVERGEIDTVITGFHDLYGRLLGKRVSGQFFLDQVLDSGTHACDYLLAADMEMDPVPGYAFASWERGYGDLHLVPDLTTLRRAAWLPRTALILCDPYDTHTHAAVEQAPRQMLRRQVERARSLGFAVMGGTELEFYVFNESYESARAKRYHDLRPAAAYIEDYHILQGTREEGLLGAIRNAAGASGVPIESSKGEWGPGQQEINLVYDRALVQADNVAIVRHAAKEIAEAQGRSVSFMAKWDAGLAGSGLHLHLSLWDLAAERPLFAGAEQIGATGGSSDLFRHFLGGWMAYAEELTALYAPYVNSYKRFQGGSFAPTGLAWSNDNRTAAFRVVGHGPSLRIECRIPGADANPYIVYAASIAAGLEGIERGLEPPAAFQGDIYQAAALRRVRPTLRDAITALEDSVFARRAFGEEVVDHWLHFVRTEQRTYDEAVTCWELARYFERV